MLEKTRKQPLLNLTEVVSTQIMNLVPTGTIHIFLYIVYQ